MCSQFTKSLIPCENITLLALKLKNLYLWVLSSKNIKLILSILFFIFICIYPTKFKFLISSFVKNRYLHCKSKKLKIIGNNNSLLKNKLIQNLFKLGFHNNNLSNCLKNESFKKYQGSDI